MGRVTRLLSLFLAASVCAAQTQYQDAAARLIGAALTDEDGLARLEYLCDRIGNRVSGSPQLEKAIAFTAEEMRRAGLENVRLIPAKVPHWVRGKESATLLTPLKRPLHMLGLGNSVGTAPEGITADVVAVSNFDELAKSGRAKVAGKIVLYNAVFESYGKTVAYRVSGASTAAKLGAVAVLVRSITPTSLRSPHTGVLAYDEAAPKIPAAAVSLEDADSIARLTARGVPVKVHLAMEARMLTDADSNDVIGEIRGRDKPGEIVVLGGHIDSWDVGQGAHDDGAGVMAALEAVALIQKLNLHPRRTIRVVAWTNEENGGAGGKAYREWVGAGVKDHVAAIEMDGGAEKPVGFGVGLGVRTDRFGPQAPPAMASISDAGLRRLVEIGKLLDGIQATSMERGGEEADIEPLMEAGVIGFGLRTESEHYFDWHHTDADTFDKIDRHDFRECVAALAVLSYVLAEMPERFGDVR
jgi:hypothetical protein